jgi:hypothetical protein
MDREAEESPDQASVEGKVILAHRPDLEPVQGAVSGVAASRGWDIQVVVPVPGPDADVSARGDLVVRGPKPLREIEAQFTGHGAVEEPGDLSGLGRDRGVGVQLVGHGVSAND